MVKCGVGNSGWLVKWDARYRVELQHELPQSKAAVREKTSSQKGARHEYLPPKRFEGHIKFLN